MDRIRFLLLFILCGSLPLTLNAQWEDPVGRIIISHGSAMADHPDGTSRVLRRSSDVYVGDRIYTGPNGFVQLRMKDNAIIALKNQTSLSIHDYRFDGEGGEADVAALELHDGGFRAIDGLIARVGSEDYVLVTPDVDVFLTKGAGGTTFECVLQNDRTYCGVYDGSLSLKNVDGSLELDTDRSYAVSASRFDAITRLDTTPEAMGKFVFPPEEGPD